MKPSILILTFLIGLFSLNVSAQKVKPDTAKKEVPAAVPAKPQFTPDPAKVFHITLDVTGPEIFSITSALDGSLHKSQQITAAQADDFDSDNKSFAKLIRAQAGLQVDADLKKWQADTAKKLHPDLLREHTELKKKKVNN
jgi:hypothetical protein